MSKTTNFLYGLRPLCIRSMHWNDSWTSSFSKVLIFWSVESWCPCRWRRSRLTPSHHAYEQRDGSHWSPADRLAGKPSSVTCLNKFSYLVNLSDSGSVHQSFLQGAALSRFLRFCKKYYSFQYSSPGWCVIVIATVLPDKENFVTWNKKNPP